ncbi:MAG: hypothetical protein ACP5F3_07575, partial [Candidatus Syntrophosphaera sp.]
MGSELSLNQRSSQRPAELNHAGQFLSPIDKITLFFCLWMIVYMIIGTAMGRTDQPEIHLPAYFSIFTGILLLAWMERNLALKPRLLKALQ